MSHEQNPPPTLYGQYAGFTTRLVAFVLDRLIVVGLLALSVPAWRFIEAALPLTPFTDALGKAIIVALPLVFSSLYNISFWLLAGQTPGKRIMGLRVIRTDGRRIGLLSAVVRDLAYWLSALLFLGFLWILVDERRQGWHDKLARTLVVYSWPEVDQMVKPKADRAWLQRLTSKEDNHDTKDLR